MEVKVSIVCLVFNHEDYLRDCLNGFINQQTNFPFEVFVHDDASTDRSALIIREFEKKYPDIIKPIYQNTNQYTKIGFAGIDKIIEPHLHGEYIAFCEGDDFWDNPNKLQKQVDFLDTHPDYSMVCAYHKVLFEDSGYISNPNNVVEKDLMYGDFVISNNVATATTMYRLPMYKLYLKEIDPATKGWYMGDVPLWLYMSANGKVRKQGFVPIVYRNHKGSASHPEDIQVWYKMKKSCEDCINFFLEKYPLKEADINYIRINGIPLIKGGVLKGFLPEYQRGIQMKKKLGITVTIKERLLYLLVCCRLSRWITRQVLYVRNIVRK